jgi:hypothetical protein
MALPKTLSQLSELDLSFMRDDWSESMIRDGMRAIIKTEDSLNTDVWKFLREYSPPEGQGFMFCGNEIVSKIGSFMESGHSGTSFGWTMRNLEFIAKNGIDQFRLQVRSN